MNFAMFDTNILIDHLKGRKEATLVLKQCIDSNIIPACSVVTRIELFTGLREGEEKHIEYFLWGNQLYGINTIKSNQM